MRRTAKQRARDAGREVDDDRNQASDVSRQAGCPSARLRVRPVFGVALTAFQDAVSRYAMAKALAIAIHCSASRDVSTTHGDAFAKCPGTLYDT